MPIADCDVLKLLQGCDQDAVTVLYGRYSAIVYTVALRILKTPASAEDVVQDMFLQILRNPSCVNVHYGGLHGWFVVASRNRAISEIRKKQLLPLDNLTLISPSRIAEDAERKVMCERLIDGLSDEFRMLLRMAFYHDMSYSEIATTTGVPLGTIKTRMRSALTALKKTVALQV